MASIWRLRSHVKSGAVARSLREASGSSGTGRGGDPTGGQTGPRGGGQQEEGKDLRRLVDPKGSADDGKRSEALEVVWCVASRREVLNREGVWGRGGAAIEKNSGGGGFSGPPWRVKNHSVF